MLHNQATLCQKTKKQIRIKFPQQIPTCVDCNALWKGRVHPRAREDDPTTGWRHDCSKMCNSVNIPTTCCTVRVQYVIFQSVLLLLLMILNFQSVLVRRTTVSSYKLHQNMSNCELSMSARTCLHIVKLQVHTVA